MDAHGYPTAATLMAIRNWPIVTLSDCEALLAFVRQAWSYPHYFTRAARRSRPAKGLGLRRLWSISTGGWSGNESLIDALEANRVFWMLCWASSRRGGHHEFETREDGSEKPK